MRQPRQAHRVPRRRQVGRHLLRTSRGTRRTCGDQLPCLDGACPMCRISREPVTAVTARGINIDAEVYLDEQSPAGSRVRRAGLWGRVYLGAVDRRRHARRFGLAARLRRRARVLQPGRADTSGHRLGPGGEGPQFATGSPRPHAGEATRPPVVSVLDAANSVGRLPARRTPPPGWCRSGHRPHPPRGRWPPLALAARVSSPRVRDRTRCLRAAWVNRINTHH